ncbi:hypothetical protein VTN96DRAFT_3792 [Rasamsonia emersonii]
MSHPIVDIHTHVYPSSYLSMLRARTKVPYVHDPDPDSSSSSSGGRAQPLRLIILSSDDDPSIPPAQRGRPVDASYTDIAVKLEFMRRHGISTSVISLANPWLDFVEPEEARGWAERINNDLEDTCARVNKQQQEKKNPEQGEGLLKKLFFFGVLPLSAPDASIVAAEIARLKTLPHMRGVIMGTSGLGQGLDDSALDPVWQALQDTDTLLFLHPHYGLPDEAFGGADVTARYGHVLPLALGFPVETTIAVTRMLLSGVFDRFPRLKILLAHSGGTLPFLAGRIESCIAHERRFVANGGNVPGPRRSVWEVLRTNIFLDAVVYGEAGLKAAVQAGGSDRILFGTDHPFFPPLDGKEDEPWLSVTTNFKAIEASFGEDKDAVRAVLGGNAVRILNLE